MTKALQIRPDGALDFLSLGALIHRLDPGVVPFRKAQTCAIHVSGGEFNTAANLADCFGMRTGVASAMVDYPIGDLIAERVRAMGVKPFYKRFKHDGARGPNMATVYSDQGYGVRGPVVFYNRANEAAAQLKPGDFDWDAIFGAGVRWFHSGGIFAALSDTTSELIIEAHAGRARRTAPSCRSTSTTARSSGRVSGGPERAPSVLGRIVELVDVLVGNEEDLQKGLGIAGPEVAAKSKLDPSVFVGMIDKVVEKLPADQGRRDDAARSALDQPPHLGRRGLDQRQGLPLADVRARRPRPRRRRRRLRRRRLLRPDERRDARRGREARLGARRAPHDVPRRHDDGDRRSGARVRQGRLGADPAIGLGVRGSGFGVRGSGFGVRGSGFEVRGSRFDSHRDGANGAER